MFALMTKGSTRHFFFSVLFCATCLIFNSINCKAQVANHIIQLSGMILGEDSITGVPGVHIYVPKAGRGTTSNYTGFFSMPVLSGDSVVISSVGYVRQFYIVPQTTQDYLTIIVELTTDNTLLNEVTILPFPTEEVFKQAVLALNYSENENGFKQAYDAQLYSLMVRTTPMDGNLNHRYYMEQYNNSVTDRNIVRTNPFFNPFNWVRFFRDLKKKKK